jgi:four helix bundle protein
MAQFDHERLDAYQVAIDFVALANDVVEHLPRGRAHLADQLQRASLSVPLNIAEGAGEFSPKDKRRFYRMALRSATECSAILDVCRRLDLAQAGVLSSGRDLLLRIVSMLTRLVLREEEPGTGTGTGTGTSQK